MVGIEALKQAAKAVISFGDKLEDALEDGKLTFLEGITIAIGTAPDAFKLLQKENIAELKEEFLDLDEDEKDELSVYVAEELDLDADTMEFIVEAGFDFLLSLDSLVRAIKAGRA